MGCMPMTFARPAFYYHQPIRYHWKRGTIHHERVYLYRNGHRIGRYRSDQKTYAKRTHGHWGKERHRWPVQLPKRYR